MPSNFKVLAGASGEPIDPNFRNVTLLLHGDGNNGGQNNAFVDSSSNHFPISRNGNTTQGSLSPYGSNWSNYFNGTNSRMSVADNAAFGFGTGNFTIEFWLYYTGGNGYKFFFVNNSGSGNYVGYGLQINTLTPWIWNNGDVLVASSNITPNTWQHHAVVRNGSTLTIYLNGVAIGSTTWTIDLGNSRPLTIGWNGGNDNQSTPGYFSNFRVIKGTALYTTNFTPPTTPLTAISGTSLLTCQSNRFRDLSTNNFTITTSGEVSVSNFGPFAPSSAAAYDQSDVQYWSGSFNGGTDRVQVPVTSNMYLGTTYTIEAWAYYSGTSYGARPIFSQCESFQGGFAGLTLTLNTSGNLVAEYRPATSGAVTTITGPTVTPNAWFHIALVSDNSSAKLFVNGQQVGSTTTFGDYPSAKTTFVAVGSWGHGWNDGGIPAAAWIGFISNMRVVKGVAVYSTNFTPPTSPLTAVSGTVLLTCQNAAFTDNSSVKNILTPVSNATVVGNSPYNPVGYWSNSFDGSGDYLTVPYSTGLQLPGDFTIEAWVYLNSRVTSFPCIVANYSTYAANGGFAIFAGHNFNATKYTVSFNGSYPVLTSSSSIVYGSWTHVAVVRSGSTLTLYINGVAEATATNSATVTGTGDNWWIATSGDSTASSYINGSISNLRIVKGTAVYTSAFTPPTTPLTAISGTSLLTCQANRLIDGSTNAFTITRNGDVSVVDFDPFTSAAVTSTGGSSYYDGDTDYLSINNNAAFVLNGTFTLESWVYPTGDYLKYQCIITKRAGDTPAAWQLFMNINNGYLGYYNGTGYVSSAPVPLNQWSHVAGVYDGTNINLYLNGVRVLQSATTNTDQSTGVKIGYHFSSVAEPFKGYLADVRVVKGVQVYSGTTYTVPTAPLTAISGTSLLVNGRNAAIFDNSMKNNFETIGNAQISTSVKKFGTGSMYFDGSGDYLTRPNSDLNNLGTGDFTIELWFKSDTGTMNTHACLVASYSNPTSGSWAFKAQSGTSGYIEFASYGPSWNDWITTTNIAADQAWHHCAATRSGNTLRIFVDGTVRGTWDISGANSFTGGGHPLTIGFMAQDPTSYINGNIDDVRITRGIARYTANFTPPTAPFPNK